MTDRTDIKIGPERCQLHIIKHNTETAALTPLTNYKMDELSRISTAHCSKVFVHRDFSEGTSVRFQTKFPQDLDGRIDRAAFDRTVSRINEIFVKAESLGGRTYCESCMACLTAYLSYLCVDTYYEKCLKEVSRFIEEQNKTVYVPRGLMLVDPVERGLRVLEICVLQDQGTR